MTKLDNAGLDDIASLTLAFNSLIQVDSEYVKNPSEELLEKSINLSCYIQDGCQKYDISLQQLSDLSGYQPKVK